MNILSIHSHYKLRGGEEESTEAEEAMLREYGHHVDEYKDDNHRVDDIHPVQMGFRTVWSMESYREIKALLSRSDYNIVHVQNFFPMISPSVYYAAKEQGVPVVQTLRNYRLLCPNALFFRDGNVCESCLGKSFPYPGIVHKCYRHNRLATLATAMMLSFHRSIDTWNSLVDMYITLTEFSRQKFIEGGIPPEKIVVKPNFITPTPNGRRIKGDYALYVGRLSVEKGLDILLQAWKLLSYPMPLKIVGDGPLAVQCQEMTTEYPHIECLGRQSKSEVLNLMERAKFLVFPSQWYETFGRVAVEAFSKGTPVIGAHIGAIAEIIEHQRTGLYFQPDDPHDLAAQVEWSLRNPDKMLAMGKAARAKFERKYTAQNNYPQLMNIYKLAQSRKVSYLSS